MYSQPPPWRSNIHPCGQCTINAPIITGMSAAAAHRLSKPTIRKPPQTSSVINTGIAVHPGNPFFSKNSIVPGNVNTSGLSRPWVNTTAPTVTRRIKIPTDPTASHGVLNPEAGRVVGRKPVGLSAPNIVRHGQADFRWSPIIVRGDDRCCSLRASLVRTDLQQLFDLS
jgi:hypothetical protein